jgi:putative phosphonate metabolism protein
LAPAPRFAIYFVPAPESALYRFGAGVLGYDCYGGEEVAPPDNLGLSAAERDELTREPRTYGFHATLKAPFRLQPQFDQADLIAAVRRLAAAPRRIPVIAPAVELIAGFVAIVPPAAAPAVQKLADNCVIELDHFRHPMTPQERERRLAAGLSAQEIANLDRFGYRYVGDAFRFHMTLTGRMAPERQGAVHALLKDAFARAVGDDPIPIDRLAVLRQDDAAARFRVIEVLNLRNL